MKLVGLWSLAVHEQQAVTDVDTLSTASSYDSIGQLLVEFRKHLAKRSPEHVAIFARSQDLRKNRRSARASQ